MFADCKEFTKCNSRQSILLYLPHATGKFLKIAQLKPDELLSSRQTSVLRSSVVGPSLRKLTVPGTNPTVGKNFSFCNSHSTREPIPCFR